MEIASIIPIIILMIVLNRRKRIIAHFINSSTTNIANAKTLKELGMKNWLMLKWLIKKGIVMGIDNKYYLDNSRLTIYKSNQKHVFLNVCLVVCALVTLLTIIHLVITAVNQ